MKTALIAYELSDTRPENQASVKAALIRFIQSGALLQDISALSPFPRWANLQLPDTSILVALSDPATTAKEIAEEVAHVIQTKDLRPKNVSVTLLRTEDYFLRATETGSAPA